MKSDTTDFGYETVKSSEKVTRVKEVFERVAGNYDVMNDAMSLGLHHLWKAITVNQAQLRPHHQVLDLACGTGDIALKLAKKITTGHIIMCDINGPMLAHGRNRAYDKGLVKPLSFIQANAEHLPFASNSFDLITIGFGLRNVTDKLQALREMARVLKPGGRCLILEFSKVQSSVMQSLYDLYSFKVIPLLGKLIANDKESYQYLVESIRMHPSQDTLAEMMRESGFDNVSYKNYHKGIVAIHEATKF